MKKPIYIRIILISILLIFCNQEADAQSKEAKKLQKIFSKKYYKELNSGIENNDIFLNFRFGDSKNEVRNKFKQNFKDGKLSFENERGYIYEFVFNEIEHNNGYATFECKYYNNKLFTFLMTVDIHPLLKDEAEQYPMNQPYYRAGIRGNSVDLYTNKYGTPMELVQKLAPMGERGYIWIDGNRLIQIDGTNLNETFILYYDIRIQEKIKEERKNEANRQIEEKKDDI